jgi:hypothetical protein
MTTDMTKQVHADAGDATDEFLRLCLQRRWDPEALEAARATAVRENVDWEALLLLARGGGMAPLLYHVTRGQELLPPQVERDLRLDYFQTASRNTLLYHELEKVLLGLADEGVPVVLLKGAALAETVYGNVALRPMDDMDLLVHQEDVPAALGLLKKSGYTSTAPETRPGDTLIYENELRVAKPGEVDAVVEVHWNLFDSPHYQHSLPRAWFWHNALPWDVGNTAALVLGPEAQLLHLCGHLVLHHGGDLQPLWVYDVAAVIRCYADRLDWEQVLKQAVSCDLVLSLQTVLPCATEEWSAPIPAAILQQIANLRPSCEEARIVARLTAPRRPVAQRFWTDLTSIPGRRARLRYWWNNMVPSVAYMRARYSIPHRALVPLYYPYRWLRGLWGALALRY